MKSTRPAYRLLSLLLALVMVLGMLPAPHASAAGEVTYEKVSRPESGKTYVIVAEGDNNQMYALSTEEHTGYTNNSSYSYSGFEGEAVSVNSSTITSDISTNTYWKFTSSGSGYKIQNVNEGTFLGSYYTSKTNPKGGYIFLTNENDADVWTWETGSILKGSISTKQLTFDASGDHVNSDQIDEGNGSADLFTVRSKGDAISLYEVKGYTPEASVAVTGVTVDPTSAELDAGGTVTLTATVLPENASNNAVTWSSNAPTVATVDQTGKVTAVSAGTATITVTTADGSKAATCAVTVNAPAVETFEKIDADDIAVGMEIVIVGNSNNNYYALANNSSDQTYDVSVSGNTLSVSGSTDTIVWKVVESSDYQKDPGASTGELTLAFTNNGYYFGRTNSTNVVQLQTWPSNNNNSGANHKYFGHVVQKNTIGNFSSSGQKPFYGLAYTNNKFNYTTGDGNRNISFFAKPVPVATLTGITVTTQPTKTTYTAGENFDPAGMVITATYSDNSTKPVTDYTVTNGNNLTAGQTQVGITYSEGGETRNTTVSITVKEQIASTADIHLAFTSDIHNGANNTEATRLNTWLTNVGKKIGDTFETMAFAGDNGSANLYNNDFWTAVQNVMDVVSASDYVEANAGFFVDGNHEYYNGGQNKDHTNSNATSQKIQKIGAKIKKDEYVIYGFGAAGNSETVGFDTNDIAALDNYLKTVPATKPVFVISHFPIHYYSSRTTSNAAALVEVLNDYPNVIFLWGHNHTLSDNYYDEVYKAGSKLPLTSSSGSQVTINFTYAAAGCMSDSEYGTGSAFVKGKGLVAKVEGSKVTLTYYDANGNKVGTSTEITISSHEHSYATTLSYDETHHWYATTCGHDVVKDKEEHHGGTATCTAKAVCTDCGQPYGQLKAHNYGELIPAKGEVHTPEKLEPAVAAHYFCDDCDTYFTEAKVATTLETLTGTVPTHSYNTATWEKNDTQHWHKCSCGAIDEESIANHSGGTATCTAKAVCTDCGQSYGNLAAHSYDTTKWEKDEDGHWHECACGAKSAEENHIPGPAATEDTDQTCTKCGYVIETASGHVHTMHLTTVTAEPATCTEPGNILYYTCSCGDWFSDSQATQKISDKGSVVIPASGHSTTASGDKAATCEEKAYCSVCKQSYGEPNGHAYGTLISAKPAVHTKDKLEAAVAAHYFCDVCDTYFTDAKVATTLEKLTGTTPTHSYDTTEWEKDEDGHWHECACGAKSAEENHIPGPAATEDTDQTCTKCGYVIETASGHVHSKHLTTVKAKDATCTEPGNILYYTCSCGEWFSDANATTKITNKESVKTPLAKHTSKKVTGQSATCTVDGWKDYYECSVCHATFMDEALTNPIADLDAWKVGGGKIPAAHTYGEKIAKVEPIHTETELKAGKAAHYKCSVCGQFFDEDKKAVTEASLTIAAPEHNYSLEYAKNATQHWHECSCGKKFRAENHTSSGPATETESEICSVCGYVMNGPTGHVHANHLTLVAGKDATCTEPGSLQHYSCSCGKLFLDANATQETTNTVLPAKGHTEVIQNAVEPTCTEDGLTEGSFCNVCGTVFKAQETIAASGHTAIVEDEVEATCDKDGSTAGIYCEICGEYLTLPEVIPALGHDWDEGEITRKPTSTIPGVMTYTCQRCDATMTEEVPFAPVELYRISGASRVETALATADALKEALGVEAFDSIIIAYGDDFADALAGSYLAAVKSAPILLHVKSGVGDDRNEYYIDENLADGGTVYILGGTSAVPESIEDGLKATGYKVVRLAGKDRYETGLAILKEAGVSDTDEILIATGGNFADCLSASATGKPILTVNSYTNKLTDAQIEFLKAHSKNQYAIIGGTAAISQTLEDAIDAIVEKEIIRVYGDNRESTSVRVAKRYFEEPTFALIAFSGNFPDGLCGGPLAYALGAPLLLTSEGKETVTADYIVGNEIHRGYVMGGSAAISDASARACFGITSAATVPEK